MDRLGIGAKLMSGIMLATTGKVVPPPSPLSISVGISGGSVPTHVGSASGDTRSVPDGAGFRYFSANASGGSSPYSFSWTRQNGANKTALVNTNSQNGCYVSWAGMIVGEYQSATANCRVTDSGGVSATSITIVIGVQRES